MNFFRIGNRPFNILDMHAFRYELGFLEYTDSGNRRAFVVGFAATLLFVLVLLLLLFYWRRNVKQRENDYRKIQIQVS